MNPFYKYRGVNHHSLLAARKFLREHHYDTSSDNTRASLYVHWPYCLKRCTYCNFNKYISNAVEESRMKSCLMKETETLIKLSKVKVIKSIFFGGGTPSLAEPRTLAGVVETVDRMCPLAANTEITLEVNPTTVETSKLRNFKAIGVNRISLGVQALNDGDLAVLGREHTAEQAVRSISDTRDLFPGRTSVDIIFGRPSQTYQSWIQELEQVLRVCDDHVSLYQLTLERGTSLFKDVRNKLLTIPDGDLVADLYQAAKQVLESSGFTRYEASNFARNGAASAHNQWYWAAGQYIGVGPGAHGRFSSSSFGLRNARIQTLEPNPWMREVEKNGHATRKITTLSNREMLEEMLMLGLRTKEGIPSARWSNFCPDLTLEEVFLDRLKQSSLISEGLMTLTDRGMRCTGRGLDVVDSITPLLINSLTDRFTQIKQI